MTKHSQLQRTEESHPFFVEAVFTETFRDEICTLRADIIIATSIFYVPEVLYYWYWLVPRPLYY